MFRLTVKTTISLTVQNELKHSPTVLFTCGNKKNQVVKSLQYNWTLMERHPHSYFANSQRQTLENTLNILTFSPKTLAQISPETIQVGI